MQRAELYRRKEEEERKPHAAAAGRGSSKAEGAKRESRKQKGGEGCPTHKSQEVIRGAALNRQSDFLSSSLTPKTTRWPPRELFKW